MDAPHTLLKKTALFSALAFVMAGGLKAQTSFASPAASSTVTLSQGGGQVSVTSSGPGQITYNATITSQTPASTSDPTTWVSITGGASGSTPSNITFTLGNLGPVAGTYKATVTLHATTPATGVPDVTFTVTFVSGSAGGGGGTSGAIAASTNNLILATTAGNSTSGSVTLTTGSTTAVGFTVSFSPVGTWLSVVPSSNSVSNTSTATLTVGANASGFATNQSGTITVTPTGGAATTITVTLNLGTGTVGGSGTITATPNPVNMTYTSGSGIFPSQAVSLTTTTGAVSYTAVASSSNNWLVVTNGGTISTNGLVLTVSAAITGLVTGSYVGTVSIADPSGGTGSLTVNLTVNGGATAGLTLSPSTGLTFSGAVGSGSTLAQSIQVTSGISGTVSATCSSTGWLICSGNPTSINANAPTNFTVSANASGLANGTYNGQFAIQVTGSSTLSSSVNVTFVVGTGSGGTGGGVTGFAFAPSSLVFSYQIGTPRQSIAGQIVAITGNGSWTATASTTNNGGWLIPSPIGSPFQGDGTSSTTIFVDPTGLAVGTYTGGIAFTSNGVIQSLPVTLNVGSAPVLDSTPGSVLVNFHTGDATPQPTAVFLAASDGSAVTATATTTTPWITVTQNAGSSSFSITVNPAGMATGLFTGSVTVTQANLANSPLTIPVILIVNGGSGGSTSGPLTITPTALTFNAVLNALSPAAQGVSVTAATATSFTVSTSTTTSQSWLSASQTSAVTPASITIFVNSTGLALGTYNGTVTFTGGGATQTVAVTLNVTATGTGGGGNVTADHTSFAFSGQAGAANPAAQTLNISSATGSAGVAVTVTAATSSGGNWLAVSPAGGTTPLGVTVTASLAGLVAGTYNGTITVVPSGGTALSIPVSLTVSAAATVSASPTSLTFTYRAGDAAPATQTVTVSGGSSSLAFTATAASTPPNWLVVAPTSGTATPATLNVSINPAGLNASATPYTGTITVAGSGTATGSTTITVTLTVTAPLPTVSRITNAGSFAAAAAIAPGEIITLFASDAQHPIGPTPAVGLTLDSTGKVATTIGGVQVLASGFACPMIFASATQISAVVPYELAGFVFSGADVLVKFLGQTSNAIHVNVATTSPGLFTANSSGTGPGAILNSDNSVNSPANPAAKGSTVVLYLTGEGQTTPAGVTGKVTTVATTGPLTPTPLLPIAILIGPPGAQQAANFSFAGEAPGFISGAMQLNVQIPPAAASGDLPIVVSIGPNSSQAGVTVSVK